MSPPATPTAASAPPCVASAEPGTWFKDEVQPHEPQLRAYLRNSFPSVHDVDDVVQESFLRIWKAKLSRSITTTKSFLFNTARNLAIDLVRHRQVARTDSYGDLAPLPVLEERPDAADQLIYAEKIALLTQAILSLQPRCREVIILRKIKGLPVPEVALRMGITHEAVSNYGTRGTQQLRKILEARGVRSFLQE